MDSRNLLGRFCQRLARPRTEDINHWSSRNIPEYKKVKEYQFTVRTREREKRRILERIMVKRED